MLNIREVGDWIKDNVAGEIRLAGASEDNEVFIEITSSVKPSPEAAREEERIIREALLHRFPEVSKITFVVKPSIEQVEDMIRDLNKVISGPQNDDLLQIEVD